MHRYFEPKIRDRFLNAAVKNNWLLIQATAIFCIATQIFNMARVLMTNARLSTLNNRIYFGSYVALLVLAVVLLAARRLLKHRPVLWNYRAQLVLVSLFLVWQLAFGMYDIHRSIAVGKIGTVTSLVAFAALLMLEPLYAVVNLGVCYGVMILFLCALGDPNSAWNYAIIGGVSLVIYLVRISRTKQELIRERTMETMNRALEENEEKFLLTNEQYELLLQKGRLIAFEWNIRVGTVRFTHAWEEIFGEPQRIEGVEDYIRDAQFLKQRQKEELFLCIKSARQNQTYQKKDLLLPVKTGEQRWFELQLAVQCDQAGEPVLGVGLLFDIMDQKSRILELQKELSMDNFTKTLNKTALESYAVRRLHERGPDERMGMLVLDMDDFKNINDTYGHICGDYVLMRLGELMNKLAPDQSRVGRLGGDEFGAILDLTGGEETAAAYAASLIREVPIIQWEGRSLPAACSVGIAVCRGETTFLELYAAADKALYRAKRLGKGRYCIAPPVEPDFEPEPLPESIQDA